MTGPLSRVLIPYGVVVAVVLAALAWVTQRTLTLERAEHNLREGAVRQDAVRTALWRLDSAMAPIIAREAARPYFHYRAFYSADRAYTQMWEDVRPGDVIMPSPLLCAGEPFIKLHFQRFGDGTLGSPSVPTGIERDKQEAVYCSPQRVADADFLLQALAGLVARTDISARLAENGRSRHTLSIPRSATPRAQAGRWGESTQLRGNDLDARSSALTRANRAAVQQQVMSNIEPHEFETGRAAPAEAGAFEGLAVDLSIPQDAQRLDLTPDSVACSIAINQTDLTSVWVEGTAGPELLMIRAVSLGDESFQQGFWLDWSQLRDFLVGQVRGLLPGADLRPLKSAEQVRTAVASGNPLASIAAELVPGAVSMAALPVWSPTRTTLAIVWAACIVAAVTVCRMLLASVELAERRGRFVSAVTHELRTPLTTFCMYSQMLADGVVKEESARREYFATLRDESRRLAGIVEDVLAYARLSRHGARPLTTAPAAASEMGALLEHARAGLALRAQSAGMRLCVEVDPSLGQAAILAESAGVERILGNLVDNACKYAAGADDKRIHLRVSRQGSRALIEVADHGPGVVPGDRGGLFEPFERGAAHDASAIPGLGLGLSLARGLARQFGGDLRLRESSDGAGGACFVLTLPLASQAVAPSTATATA